MVKSSKGFYVIHISYSPYMTFGDFWLENAGNSSIIHIKILVWKNSDG